MFLEEQEETIDRASLIADAVLKAYIKVGRPPYDIDSQTFWFVIDNIVKAWINLFEQEYNDWLHDRQLDLDTERDIKDSVKVNGVARVGTYPPNLFKMIRSFYPDAQVHDKSFQKMFFGRYPLFSNTNYKI